MPKSDNALSLQWDVNSHLAQSKVINQNNKKEIEDFKAKTEAYKRIDATLTEYENQGIDTSIYRKKLEEKVPELSIGDKLGVVGRNVGNDYVSSFSKAFGGNPTLTHSQKMDELKQEREEIINPVSTIAAEVAVDPGTYTPIPFVKGATKLTQFGKNATVGGATSGALYTAKEYGDENYKGTDSLIAAGFGGVLNGLIATALGKSAPKTAKETIKKQTIKESDPIINETFEENVIGDDEIVNKMMGNKIPEAKKPSIFGFEKNTTIPDERINFELVGEPKDITNNKIDIHIDKEIKQSANINNNNPTYAYLRVLQKKHPEMFKSEKDVFKFINDVKNNSTHFAQGNKPDNKLLVNQSDGKTNTIGINTMANDYNLVVNANKKSRPKELRKLIDKQLEGSTIDSSNPSFKLGHGGSAETSPNMDYKSGSIASNTDSITKDIAKSQDIKLNASPTLSGALVGGASGAEVDYDGDGKQTIKDIAIGTIGGAGATKTALAIKDTSIATKASQKLKKIIDTDFVDAFSGHKIYEKKSYMKARENMISAKNAKQEDFVQLHEQLKLLSDDTRTNLHKYMSGDTNVNLTPSLKTFANNYTEQIKTTGQELVDLGILDQAQYEKFKGKYLHRVYEKDLTKKVASTFKKGKTIPGVHTRGREWTGTKAEYEKYLEDDKIGDFFGGKIEAKKLKNGQYKFTQDWTAEQRHRWGEIEDIAYTLPETLMRMSEMAEHGKMLKNVLNTKYVLDESIDGYTQLQGKRYGALKDKFVPKDIADDINEFNRVMFGEEDGSIFSKEVKEAYQTLSTFWKKSHTVYNPTAHINNLLSNVTMQYMQGINPVKALNNAKKGALAHKKLGEFRQLTAKTLVGLTKDETNKLKALTLDEDLQLYIQAEKAGLFGRSKLNDILGQYVNPATSNSGKVKGVLKKTDEISSNFYQGEDNIMRFSLLKSLTDNGKSFDEAIKEVNNTIPDYTKPMSRMARFGRKSMLTPFISWTYYSTPIILRQLKERPERAIALMGALYGINKAFGIDPYDKKDIPQQNFSMKRIPIYKNGKEVTTIKVDRWIPHNEILSPHDFVKNLTNGGAWKGGYEVLNNQNLYYGGKITYNEGARKAYDIFKHGTQQITPDAIDKVWNLTESAILSKKRRKKNPVIQPRSTTQELLNIAGFNTLSYDKQAQKKKVSNEKLK